MIQRDLRRHLRGLPVPDEHGARERGWRVVRAAFEEHRPAAPGARAPGRIALAIAIAALGLVLVLTPAGAKVVDAVRDVVKPDEEARPLTSLPAPGRLLVNSPQGPWVVEEDGSQRLLGDYRDSTWSPHGYYIAVTAGDQLSAVEPDGTVRWSLRQPSAVADPRWAPSGYRIAYRAGSSMRVVAGDGTGDHRLVPRAAPVPAAWRPLPLPEAKVSPTGAGAHVLAVAAPNGRIEVIDADSRTVLWRSAPGPMANELDWSADGSRLVALTGPAVRVFTADGELIRTQPLPRGFRATGGEFSPARSAFAVTGTSTDRAKRSVALLLELDTAQRATRRLFAGPGSFTGISWSPDGQWLLVAWRDADEWLFLRPERPGHVKTAGDVSRQFNPGVTGPAAFPGLAGWCCSATGGS